MKKLLILGSNDNVALVQVVNCAKEHGIYTIVTDWNTPDKSPAKQVSDAYWMVSTSDLDALEQKCREEKIDGVFGGTDYAVDVALELTTRLNLPYYCDKETWKYSRDKAAFKEKCRQFGVHTAKQFYVSDPPTEEEIDKIEFPVIVKPVDKSGNLGFSYCYSREDFLEGYRKAVDMSEGGGILIEKLLTGREYTAMYALADGEARLLNFWAMFSQPGMPSNCYSVSTTVTDNLDNYIQSVHPHVKQMLKNLGYRDGVVWIEFMADEEGKLNALEIGHRLSGEMLWLPLREVRGFDALYWMVHHAVYGFNRVEDLPADQTQMLDKCACGYILWTKEPGQVTDLVGTALVSEQENVNVSIMAKIGRQIDAFRYGVIVTFSSENMEEMCRFITYINQTVSLLDEKGSDILIHYDDFDAIRQVNANNHY